MSEGSAFWRPLTEEPNIWVCDILNLTLNELGFKWIYSGLCRIAVIFFHVYTHYYVTYNHTTHYYPNQRKHQKKGFSVVSSWAEIDTGSTW